jgi:hypothetical protein
MSLVEWTQVNNVLGTSSLFDVERRATARLMVELRLKRNDAKFATAQRERGVKDAEIYWYEPANSEDGRF